ncbi:MAG: hypothetical protein EZS28_044672, partial [Streblomastix strix]
MKHHFYTIGLLIDPDQLIPPYSELDEIDPTDRTTIDRITDDGYPYYDQIHFALYSLFHSRVRFILCEILRLSLVRIIFFKTFQYGGTSLPAAIHHFEEFPNPLGPVGDPTSKHIRPPPTPTSGLQPSRFSEPCFALSMLRRGNALDRLIVTNGRIVVIGSSDTGISELERLTLPKSRFFSSLTLVSPQCLPCLESTIIPPQEFHHQPFVEPYPNGMSAMGVTKQIKLKQIKKDQPDAELEDDFQESQYGSNADSDGRKLKYQLIKEKDDEIMGRGQGGEKYDWGIDWEGYDVCEDDETFLKIDIVKTNDEYKESVKRKQERAAFLRQVYEQK